MTTGSDWRCKAEESAVVDPLAEPGQLIDIESAVASTRQQTSPGSNNQTTLVQTRDVHIIHLLISAGRKIPTHEAQGEIVLHCLEGLVAVEVSGRSRALRTGQMLFLVVNEPFALQGITDASILATIVSPKHGQNIPLIGGCASE